MIVILEQKQKLTKADFAKAKQDYETYIKITIDIERKVVALGGEYHADAEKLLLDSGSKQDDIWGGGINLNTKEFEANAMVNIRVGKNDTIEILDEKIKSVFLQIAKEVLKEHV